MNDVDASATFYCINQPSDFNTNLAGVLDDGTTSISNARGNGGYQHSSTIFTGAFPGTLYVGAQISLNSPAVFPTSVKHIQLNGPAAGTIQVLCSLYGPEFWNKEFCVFNGTPAARSVVISGVGCPVGWDWDGLGSLTAALSPLAGSGLCFKTNEFSILVTAQRGVTFS